MQAGNALQVFIDPPENAVTWRLLRKSADDFTGHEDPAAILVMDGDDRTVIDAVRLKSGVPAFYKVFAFDGINWTAGKTVSGVPVASYYEATTDVLEFVRERLDVGLQEEVERGTLKSPVGQIQVLTAPPLYEATRWPVVSVHLDGEHQASRSMGEQIDPDAYLAESDTWAETEGWLADVQLSVIGWSLNPDQRIALRKALRRIVVANLPIFDSIGMVCVSFSQRDAEDFGSYEKPVYQVMCTLSCQAPVMVVNTVEHKVERIDVNGTAD